MKNKSVDVEGLSAEYYTQILFNKTWAWQIIKSKTEIKFVTIYLTKFFFKTAVVSEREGKRLFLVGGGASKFWSKGGVLWLK